MHLTAFVRDIHIDI